MIKLRRNNYIKERAQENLNYIIKSSGLFLNNRNENNWRGKNVQDKSINSTEENYQLRQILKRYQRCKDEQKGYSSKYLLQLTDLLGKKDKNFLKKRLNLYNKRMYSKEIILNNQEKTDKEPYKTISNISSRLERMFNRKKNESAKILNSSKIKKNKTNNKFLLSNTYNKTLNNYSNTLMKNKSLKIFTSKSEDKIKFFLNKNKLDESIILSQFDTSEINCLDESVNGIEKFLESGDKENYREYLQNEYKFFNDPDIKHIVYSYEKNQRIKKFKNFNNSYYLKLKKNFSVQNEFINKIRRNNNMYFNFPKLISKKNNIISNKIKLTKIPKKSDYNLNFINDCRKILFKVKNNL